jgi:hypothetical protein
MLRFHPQLSESIQSGEIMMMDDGGTILLLCFGHG